MNELNFEHRLLKKAIPVEINFRIPDESRVQTWLNTQPLDGKPLSEWFNDINAGTASRINKEIRLGLINGESIDEIARRIRGRRAQNYTDGVLGTTRRHAQSIARSAVIFANDQASQAFYRANEDLFNGEAWVLTLDSRTCFPKDTMIKTEKGYKPIQYINIGDSVLTHKGKYRRVSHTFEKKANNKLLEIQTRNGRVRCTKDHEFLVLRDGEKVWLEAQELLLTDKVYFDRQLIKKQRNHPWLIRTKKGLSLNPENIKPLALQKIISPFISFFNRIVPISSINFKRNVMRWKKEVYAVCSNLILLNKLNTSRFKTYSNIPFTTGLSGKFSIAGEGTESSFFCLTRTYSESLTTAGTINEQWRPSALLGTISNVFSFCSKLIPATLTIPSNSIGIRALTRAMDIPISVTNRYFKFITTFGAFLFNSVFSVFKITRSTAKLGTSRFIKYAKHFTTSDAFIMRGFRSFFRPKFVRTCNRTASSLTTWVKRFFANWTCVFDNRFHAVNITKIEVKGFEETVFDLEVYKDHSYVANGFVVHNCERCMAAELGSPYKLGEGPRAPVHMNCRCLRVPVVKSWRELGIDLNEAPPGTRASMNGQVPDSMTYNEWLRKQDRGVVEDALGKTKAKLFLDGDLSVTAFTDRRGNILNLEELRRKESDVFDSLGL